MSLRYRPAGFLRMSWAAVALGVHAETQTWTGEGVPEPEPVAATITLGTYIFPGWYRAAGRGVYVDADAGDDAGPASRSENKALLPRICGSHPASWPAAERKTGPSLHAKETGK